MIRELPDHCHAFWMPIAEIIFETALALSCGAAPAN